MSFRRYIMVVLSLIFLTSYVQAASFDCTRASTKVEKLVCGDQELSMNDDKLTDIYTNAMKETNDKKSLRKEQREWLENVRNRCDDVACLKKAYAARITQLASIIKAETYQFSKTEVGDLQYAAGKGDLTQVKLLISIGTDVNAKNKDGDTALMWASSHGQVAVVQTLVAAKADVNAQDKKGATALMWASGNGQVAAVRALLAAKADVNAQDKYGSSALINAAGNNQFAVVQVLLAAKANIDALGDYGTALMWASRLGNIKIVQALLASNADVNAKDKYGDTALMHASDSGEVAAVRTLLAANADVNAQDKNGETALTIALNREHVKVLRELLAAKADADAKTKRKIEAILNIPSSDKPDILIEDGTVNTGDNTAILKGNPNVRNYSFNEAIKRLKQKGKITQCKMLINVPGGRMKGSFGGLCTLFENGSKSDVMICDDDMVGWLKIQKVGHDVTKQELFNFIINNCCGGG